MASKLVKYWLMKAESDTRLVKGHNVRFSIDDFEACPDRITAWEGVRNHQAKNFMKDGMKIGDGVLFYHSNCKEPGIAGIAEVCKEGYPDHSAWDPNHPYFDPKTDSSNPRWYMVSIRLISRLPHFVSLALLKFLAASESPPNPNQSSVPKYLTKEDIEHLKGMTLLNRGRLSVQPVSEGAWGVVRILGEKGGWEGGVGGGADEGETSKKKSRKKGAAAAAGNNRKEKEAKSEKEKKGGKKTVGRGRKRKVDEVEEGDDEDKETEGQDWEIEDGRKEGDKEEKPTSHQSPPNTSMAGIEDTPPHPSGSTSSRRSKRTRTRTSRT